MGQLKGKVAVITGAASGIGRESARRFAAEGARVCVVDLADDAGEAVAAEVGVREHAGETAPELRWRAVDGDDHVDGARWPVRRDIPSARPVVERRPQSAGRPPRPQIRVPASSFR